MSVNPLICVDGGKDLLASLSHVLKDLHFLPFCPTFVFLMSYFTSFFFLLFRAALAACGSSQARGRIRAAAASLRHSQINMGSK